MKPLALTLIALILTLGSFTTYKANAANSQCQKLKAKLQSIQRQQRQANTVKRSNALKIKETKAFKNWRQCKQGKYPKKKNKTKKSRGNRAVSKANHRKLKRLPPSKAVTPFKTVRTIAINNEYQGAKQVAWLQFYQRPSQCKTPKTTQVFAFCSEDRQAQRRKFEQQY